MDRQIPISTTVRKCAGTFRKTHQDTWHEDSKKFTEEQLAALSTLLSGSSYCMFLHPDRLLDCSLTLSGAQMRNVSKNLYEYHQSGQCSQYNSTPLPM